MSEYLTSDELKLLGTMPAENVDRLEQRYPGIVVATIRAVSAIADGYLRKRYKVEEFAAPFPMALKMNVAAIVSYRLYMKQGFQPTSEQDTNIRLDKEAAERWFQEAANSAEGLIELPLRETTPPDVGAVSEGGPLFYSEASPYTWMDRQREALRDE